MTIDIEPLELTVSLTAIVITIVGSLWLLFKYYVQKRVDQQFEKKYEGYKNELQLILETKKFDFQRMTHDFSLYRNKKHECYPELYKLTMISMHGLTNLMSNWNFPNFSNFNTESLHTYLREENVDGEVVDKILSQMSNGIVKENIIYELKIGEYERVRNSFLRANSYFWISELYLSENVVNCAQIIFSTSNELFKGYVWDIIAKSYDNEEEIRLVRPDIDTEQLYKIIVDHVSELKDHLKKELSIADYDKVE